jgi:8-oxo-dGTP pyrophosphatase MutT (NUDIX family)
MRAEPPQASCTIRRLTAAVRCDDARVLTDSDSAEMSARRSELVDTLRALPLWDDRERADVEFMTAWATSGAPLWRTQKPAVPETHLVSYCVVVDELRRSLLLVRHRGALGLLLPPGGHVEVGEDPWEAAARECSEELGIGAVPLPATGTRPFFVTVTTTVGVSPHQDCSLWFAVTSTPDMVKHFDVAEFDAIMWMTVEEVLATPTELLDPHLHRAVRKLNHTFGW